MGLEEIRNIKRGIKSEKELRKLKPYSIPKKSAKRIAKEAEQKVIGKPPSKLELDNWFHSIKTVHFSPFDGGKCMECNSFIPNDFSRHATAHLLPKKLFPSVATHPLNYLILGAGCGCHDKTHRIDKFVTMKIWPEAACRIKLLIPLLPFDELKYLSSQLLTALDNT